MPEIKLPPPMPKGEELGQIILTPLIVWEFGQQRHPMEKPLYVAQLTIRDVDPRVKHFDRIDLKVTHQL